MSVYASAIIVRRYTERTCTLRALKRWPSQAIPLRLGMGARGSVDVGMRSKKAIDQGPQHDRHE